MSKGKIGTMKNILKKASKEPTVEGQMTTPSSKKITNTFNKLKGINIFKFNREAPETLKTKEMKNICKTMDIQFNNDEPEVIQMLEQVKQHNL